MILQIITTIIVGVFILAIIFISFMIISAIISYLMDLIPENVRAIIGGVILLCLIILFCMFLFDIMW